MFIFLLIYTYFIVWIWGSLSSICLQIPFPSLWLVFSLSLVVSFDTQKFFILNSNAIACTVFSFFSFFFCRFLKKSIYLFLERGEGRKKKRGRGTSIGCLLQDLAHNPGMCLGGESNQRPFGLQSSTQSTEPH